MNLRVLRAPILIALGLTICLGVFFFASEKIQAYGGMGYDGVPYVGIARSPYHFFIESRADYLYQRFLPSALVGLSLRPFAEPLLAPQAVAITGFALWNAFCIGLSAYWLIKSGRLLGMRDDIIVLTLTGLLGSFALLKMPAYYPILTDVTAFTEGCALLYAFLARRIVWMIVAFLCLFFTWPSAVLPAACLLVFRQVDVRNIGNSGLSGRWRVGFALMGAAGLGIASYVRLRAGHFITPGGMTTQPLMEFLAASYAVLLAYLAAAFAFIAVAMKVSLKTIWSSLRLSLLVGLVLFVGLFPVIRDYLFKPIPIMAEVGDFALWAILTHGIVAPGRFVVAHVMYFGPLLIVAALLWPRIARLGAEWGYGLLAVLAIGAAHSIETESRHMMFYWPFVGVLAGWAVQDRFPQLSTGVLLAFGALCFLVSRAWLPIGGHPVGNVPDPQNSFADQRYFMTQGPWLTHEWYAVQLVAMLFVAALVIIAIRWRTWSASPEP